MNATNEEAINKKVKLQNTTSQRIKVSFLKEITFDRYNWQDGFAYQATITCDGLSAQTDEFTLKFEKEKIEKVEKCLCKKTSWTADDLRYIVTQLRKMDDIKTQREFDSKGNPYFADENGKKVSSNDRGKSPKEGYDYYYKKTSFFDRSDDVDGKPLKDRIFFYDSDKNEDNINYNLNEEYANYEIISKYLNIIFKYYKINSCIQRIHFLAQIYLETNRFRTTYEDKPKNNYSGGEFYRGRGMKQITHDYNYLNYYDERKGKDKNLFELYKNNRETYYKKNGKVDYYESVVHFKNRTENEFISDDEMAKFEDFVNLLSTSIYWACDSAGWYWNKTKLNNFANNDENA